MVIRAPGPANALRCETVPDPTPGPHEIVIQVAACGVCFHDVVVRNGILRRGIELPCVPGHEVAGTVVAIGSGARGLRVGDRVATTQRSFVCGQCRYCRSGREPLCDQARFLGDAGLNGGYAEFVAVDAGTVVPVPEGVPLEAAAIAACAIGTMLHAVTAVGRVGLGERVLITGAGGGLGLHGVQLARQAGAVVIGQTTAPAKAEAIRAAGAQHVVVTGRGDDFAPAVRAIAGGGVDVAIDTVGTPVFASVRRSLAKGGRWVLAGQVTGEFVPFNPAQLFLHGLSMLSATSTTLDELRVTLGLLARGEIRPAIDRRLPLERAAEAHELVESGAALGRVVLEPAA